MMVCHSRRQTKNWWALYGCALWINALAFSQVYGAEPDYTYKNNEEYLRTYPNYAEVDKGPLKENITADDLRKRGAEGFEGIKGAEYLDRLYAQLTAGAWPHGFYKGSVVMPDNNGIKYLRDQGAPLPKNEHLEYIAELLWKGKFFDTSDRGRRYLKNLVNCKKLDPLDYWLKGGGVIGCHDGPQDAVVTAGGNVYPKSMYAQNMKFSAKVYCGQSMSDSRRESIIIDYKFGMNDIVADYGHSHDDPEAKMLVDKKVDWIAAKAGLAVRDEVRMVKPGLYLGRAYAQSAFMLFFILEYVPGTGINDQGTNGSTDEACWLGTQRQKAMGIKQSNYGNYK